MEFNLPLPLHLECGVDLVTLEEKSVRKGKIVTVWCRDMADTMLTK